MTVSFAVMAHPRRAGFVQKLQEQIPQARVAWDQRGDRWDTGRRALGAFDPGADAHCVVQDDAILSADFVAGVELLTRFVPDNPISLYTGRTRPFGKPVREAVRRVNNKRLSWLVLDGLFWGVGVVLPIPMLKEMVGYHDLANVQIKNYDSKMSFWLQQEGIRTFYCQPSLVEHRDVAENPSLVPGRSARGRVAHRFIGEESPLEHNWDTRALYLTRDGKYRVVTRQQAAARTENVEALHEDAFISPEDRDNQEVTA